MRFGKNPITAPYLLQSADFVGVHKFDFLRKLDVLGPAWPGATVLLNSPYDAASVWDHLPRSAQQHIVKKGLRLFVIDEQRRAGPWPGAAGEHHPADLLLRHQRRAAAGRRHSAHPPPIEKSYGQKGRAVVEKNFAAVDATLKHLQEVSVPKNVTSKIEMRVFVPADAPDQIKRIMALQFAGRGDEIPVSALPIDGAYTGGTTQYEKRNMAFSVPVWKADLCIQCGQCSIVCPHSVIRAKAYDGTLLKDAPEDFPSAPVNARGYPDKRFTLQIAVEDCTGCGICIDHCPAHDPLDPGVRAINLSERLSLVESRTA